MTCELKNNDYGFLKITHELSKHIVYLNNKNKSTTQIKIFISRSRIGKQIHTNKNFI